jgi:hypothetical protein
VKSNREFFGANREILGVETGNLRAEIQTGLKAPLQSQAEITHISIG